MFTEIMNAERLGAVYEAGLVPFIQQQFPDGHRLYQDNDPKHSSKYVHRRVFEATRRELVVHTT